jgi:hypothetical protein
MISKSNISKQNNRPQGQGKDFISVRSGSFYGLKIQKKILEASSYKRGIVASPNFYFYDNDTKVMIDFSDYKNSTTDEQIKEFFTLNLTGQTFTVEQSEWVNTELFKNKISLNGTYTINVFQNNILFANVVDVEEFETNIKRYDKKYFVDVPNFTILVNTTQDDIPISHIVNHLGKNSKNSFSYLGANIGDYVSLSISSKKFEIIDIFIDEEGKEIVEVLGDLSTQDLTTSLTNVVIYIKNQNFTNITDFDNVITGKCNVTKSGVAFCYDNQTELQCECRKNKNLNEISTFTKGIYCPDVDVVVKRTTPIEELSIIARDTKAILNNVTTQLSQSRIR